MADAYIKDRKATVRSEKSIARWVRALGEGGYADRLRSLPVDKIDTDNVLAVLRPLWERVPASAKVLRGYIEGVLNVAKVSGHRSGENPAAWAGHLALILPPQQRLGRGHHAALPFNEVPAFLARLRDETSGAARALEFTILTAARTSEALHAEWSEIDLERSVWTIPANRMKAAREHRVPISADLLQLLEGTNSRTGYLFPGKAIGKPLSNMAMDMVLRRMGVEVTVHGFRSSFRDWAGEMTDTPREVAEAALAHTVGNSAEQAYRRGDALEKRRVLMGAWGTYCRPKA
jgi:integrase